MDVPVCLHLLLLFVGRAIYGFPPPFPSSLLPFPPPLPVGNPPSHLPHPRCGDDHALHEHRGGGGHGSTGRSPRGGHSLQHSAEILERYHIRTFTHKVIESVLKVAILNLITVRFFDWYCWWLIQTATLAVCILRRNGTIESRRSDRSGSLKQ